MLAKYQCFFICKIKEKDSKKYKNLQCIYFFKRLFKHVT